MKISEAIKKLEVIQSKHGNIPLHLEVGMDKSCSKCGQDKYVMFCGTCIHISTINVSSGINAYLFANNGE